jgi:hypothetical protein
MKTLKEYIFESWTQGWELSPQSRKKLLGLDREYNELVKKINEFNSNDIPNLDEEMDKFFKARNDNKKYYPKLKLNYCPFDSNGIVGELEKLLGKFENFQECYLSKFYIENIKSHIKYCKYFIDKKGDPKKSWDGTTVSDALYKKAIKLLKTCKYQSIRELETISVSKVLKAFEGELEKLGYGWDVELVPHQSSKVDINTPGIIKLSSNAKFYKVELESLIEHYIRCCIGRKYYGYQSGLYIFIHGLVGSNKLTNGLIYNGILDMDEPKPNTLLNICIKYIIGYLKQTMGFYEIFNELKQITKDCGVPDRILFKMIAKSKHELVDTKLPGGFENDVIDFEGYQIVNKMNDDEIGNILKYNIGHGQLKELPNIKNFLEQNKFKPIKI